MTEFLLVRHGQSTWNAAGKWQGQADPPLSALGRLQAEHAGRSVGFVDVIVTSDLERAHHTGLIIGEAIGVGPVVVEPALRERDAGEWSGKTRDQIEVEWPGYLTAGDRPPGWEPQDQLMERALDTLHRLETKHPDAEVLVITHGGVVYAIEEHHGEPWSRIGNLEARRLRVEQGTTTLGDRLELIDHDEITVPDQL
ncbi:MAG: histidine phosphatase family protein [Acidimicrobiales bacterium]|nr:histidine phosphatase family protein [Acidimicrobiales bacterium]